MRLPRPVLLMLAFAALAGTGPLMGAAATAVDAQVLFQNVCAQCHGARGEGNEQIKSPSIANLPSWYVTTQLSNFHDGRRGRDQAADPQGAMMAAIAKALTAAQIEAVANHVEKLPLIVPDKAALKGANVQAGQELFYERCMECHRYNASGEMVFGSPPLVGRQGWYLLAQLQKFKGLHRGAAKGDEKGAKMVQMATQFIEDEQAMKDVVSFILTLNPDSPEENAEAKGIGNAGR